MENAESLEKALINTESSSVQHEDNAENLAQQKTDINTSAKEPATQDAVKPEDATETKVEGDTSDKEPATPDAVKPEGATEVKAAGDTSTKEPVEEPIPPTHDASKELSAVKELTSKLKTTMQTISIAKNSLIQQNG